MNLAPQAQASASATVLEVRDLRTIFRFRGGTIWAVNGLNFSVAVGELLGVVGESGSGKSVTMMSLMKLLPMPPAEIVSGSVRLGGRELLSIDPNEMRDVRGGEVGFIFQDTMTALNPVFTVGYQIMEPLRAHLGLGRRAARVRAVELMALVGSVLLEAQGGAGPISPAIPTASPSPTGVCSRSMRPALPSRSRTTGSMDRADTLP